MSTCYNTLHSHDQKDKGQWLKIQYPIPLPPVKKSFFKLLTDALPPDFKAGPCVIIKYERRRFRKPKAIYIASLSQGADSKNNYEIRQVHIYPDAEDYAAIIIQAVRDIESEYGHEITVHLPKTKHHEPDEAPEMEDDFYPLEDLVAPSEK